MSYQRARIGALMTRAGLVQDAGMVQAKWGVAAERRPLEGVTRPLSASEI